MQVTTLVCFLLTAALTGGNSSPTTVNSVSIVETELTICERCECAYTESTYFNSTSVDVNCTGRSMLEISPKDIPRYIGVLDLSDNNLRSGEIAASRSRVSIRKLLLKKNKIQSIAEPNFYHVEDLLMLDLSNNKIFQIVGRAFLYLKKLKSLDLSRNFLREVPPRQFSMLKKLEELNLSGNPLHEVGPNIISMPSLLRLDLSKTALSDIHEQAFKGCDRLLFLDLAWNNMEIIPTRAFQYLDQLVHLRLTGNPVHVIEEKSFWYPTNLVEIELDQMPNLQEVFSGAFSRQTSLVKINLNHNIMLRRLDALAFQGLHSLSIIDLRQNKLHNIGNGTQLSVLCANSDVRLSGNPWRCDCHLKWMLACASTSNSSLITCAEPKAMEGYEIDLLTKEQLTCDDDIWLFGIAQLDRKTGVILFCLGLMGALLSCCGIFLMLKYQPKITWRRLMKDKDNSEVICYVRMHNKEPKDLKCTRY